MHKLVICGIACSLAMSVSASPKSEFSAACGVPDRHVASTQVVWEGRGADDPENYGRGWFSIRTVDSEHIMPWGGNSHSSQGNNSIRLYDVRTNKWRIIHPNVGSHYDKATMTWDQKAKEMTCPKDPTHCKIVTNRDNHIQWYIPDRQEMLIMGKPAGDVMYGGVYSLKSQRWTVAWKHYSDVGSQGYLKPPVGLNKAYSWGYNAAQAWVDADGPGGSPGIGIEYGGNIYGSAKDSMWKITPSKDGKYVFDLSHTTGNKPGALSHNRNGAIAAGSCFYMFGGAHANKSASDEVWRYNVKNNKWKRMAPMPNKAMWNAAAYDPATNSAVIATGTAKPHVFLYNLEADTWQDITQQVPMPGVSQPAIAHAYGRYVVMGRKWYDDGEKTQQRFEDSHVNRIYRFIVAAKTYKQPRITAISMPGGTKSNSYNKAPAQSAKHMSWAYDPTDGRYYSAGGDFGGTPGFQSYRQEIWSWSPKTDTWIKALPYCVPDGQVSWMHPDPIGWNYDPSRKGFWFTPGMMPSGDEACKTGTYYRWQVLFFNPKTHQFSRPKQPPEADYPGSTRANGLGGDPIYHSVYLPKEDALLRIGRTKVAIFDIKRGVWDVRRHNGPSFPHGVDFRFTVPQLVGRDVYLGDANRHGSGARLFRYNLDDKRLHLVRDHTWGGLYIGRSLVSFPTWIQPKQQNMSIYDLVTGTTATAPVRTPEIMESSYGTSWTVSQQRREMFVFGQQKPWGTWFSKFYLIDLSFLPDGLAHMGGAGNVVLPRADAQPAAAPVKTTPGANRETSRAAPAHRPQPVHRASHVSRDRPIKAKETQQTQPDDGVHLPPPGKVIMSPDVGVPYNLPPK